MDVDRSGPVWAYTPRDHKSKSRGRDRVIHLGPKAQQVLAPWLDREPGAYAFSSAEVVAERRAAMRAARKARVQPSQEDRSKPDPKRRPRERYDSRTYCHAIRYGFRRAGIEPWHPRQLRHTAAPRLRREFGLDAARVILGHAMASTTENYAELDHAKAFEVTGRVG